MVERHLAKVDVAGSTPVSRSNNSLGLSRFEESSHSANPALGVCSCFVLSPEHSRAEIASLRCAGERCAWRMVISIRLWPRRPAGRLFGP